MMLALKPPQRPLSAVTTTSRIRAVAALLEQGMGARAGARAASSFRTSSIFRA